MDLNAYAQAVHLELLPNKFFFFFFFDTLERLIYVQCSIN